MRGLMRASWNSSGGAGGAWYTGCATGTCTGRDAATCTTGTGACTTTGCGAGTVATSGWVASTSEAMVGAMDGAAPAFSTRIVVPPTVMASPNDSELFITRLPLSIVPSTVPMSVTDKVPSGATSMTA
jgi:hypothetical protein